MTVFILVRYQVIMLFELIMHFSYNWFIGVLFSRCSLSIMTLSLDEMTLCLDILNLLSLQI